MNAQGGLVISNLEHFLGVVEKVADADAKTSYTHGLMAKLLGAINSLVGTGDQHRVVLGYDFAPLSFSISWQRKVQGGFEEYMHGGLIFHNGGGVDDGTFSVELDPPKGPHWTVHT